MALVQERLLIHADALYYVNYGNTIDEVNAATTRLLHGNDTAAWDQLLGYAGERLVFDERKPGGAERARQFLKHFGGEQIIHGHTPIAMLNEEPIERIVRAYVYAEERVVDVDGGMYKGGSGFVYEAPPLNAAVTSGKDLERSR